MAITDKITTNTRRGSRRVVGRANIERMNKKTCKPIKVSIALCNGLTDKVKRPCVGRRNYIELDEVAVTSSGGTPLQGLVFR